MTHSVPPFQNKYRSRLYHRTWTQRLRSSSFKFIPFSTFYTWDLKPVLNMWGYVLKLGRSAWKTDTPVKLSRGRRLIRVISLTDPIYMTSSFMQPF